MEPTAIISVVGVPHCYTIRVRSPNFMGYQNLLLLLTPLNIQYQIVKQAALDNGVAYTLNLYGHRDTIGLLCQQLGWRVRWL